MLFTVQTLQHEISCSFHNGGKSGKKFHTDSDIIAVVQSSLKWLLNISIVAYHLREGILRNCIAFATPLKYSFSHSLENCKGLPVILTECQTVAKYILNFIFNFG